MLAVNQPTSSFKIRNHTILLQKSHDNDPNEFTTQLLTQKKIEK